MIFLCLLTLALLIAQSARIYRNRDAMYICEFDIENFDKMEVKLASNVSSPSPRQVWSLTKLPEISHLTNPKYPIHIVRFIILTIISNKVVFLFKDCAFRKCSAELRSRNNFQLKWMHKQP